MDMIPTRTIDFRARTCLAASLVTIFILFSNACTVKREPIQPGVIPRFAGPSAQAEDYGKFLYDKLRQDYEPESDIQKKDKLNKVFDKLTKAAEVDHLSWNLHLFEGPEIVDVRAVHGNYIFVWSGTLDAVTNDDELAGLLAYELSHTITHHTDPVEFTLASEAFFGVAEIATSVGLIIASQGMVVISGQGWMRWAYVEASDLDPLDREYSEDSQREAAGVAYIIATRAKYSPQALVDFWKRAAEDDSEGVKYDRLSRNLPPPERAAMLEDVFSSPVLQNLEDLGVQASVVVP
jgi:predicted Zn-dependent protease